MDIQKDLVAASATPLVLAILSEGESYGYAIIKRVAELSDGELQWTDGMVYPLLHRLERNGFVKAVWGKSETGRRRKYYRLTPEGAEHLSSQRRQWQLVDLALRGIWRGIVLNAVDGVAIGVTISKQEGTWWQTT
jgi:DNA-binding PadR family transcriptional regulator